MRRRITRRPSRTEARFGGIMCIGMALFVLVVVPWADLGFVIFKLLWCAMAFAMGVHNLRVADGKAEMGGYEITEEDDMGSPCSRESRLEELRGLYDRHLITEEEYEEKRRAILDEL